MQSLPQRVNSFKIFSEFISDSAKCQLILVIRPLALNQLPSRMSMPA
jgi:hypothetical protein